MFEKEAEEWTKHNCCECCVNKDDCDLGCIDCYVKQGYIKGSEFGYNKAKEDIKNELMMKLKDEGIVKVLKDSIFRNKKLSSQEQQELCAWIECAMDFGENLDECAKELEEAKALICNLLRVTYGEGWNYSLDVKVKAEQFLKEK